jgi:hypothetical protein
VCRDGVVFLFVLLAMLDDEKSGKEGRKLWQKVR